MTVTIKNFPLDYLKGKNKEFFNSTAFKDAVEVFDKNKLPVTDISKDLNHDDFILPYESLKKLITCKYNDLDYEYSTDEEREDLIFIGLKGKFSNGSTFTPRRYITKSAKEITCISNFLSSTLEDNIFIALNSKAKKEVSYKNSSELLKDLLKPENTENAIFDIINKANFYDRIENNKVFDDVEYLNYALKSILISKISVNTSLTQLSLEEGNLEKLYPAYNKDLKIILKDLKRNLTSKYKYASGNGNVYKEFANNSIQKYDSAFSIRSIESILSMKKARVPIIAYKQNFLNSDKVNLRILETVKNYKIQIFDENGVCQNNKVESKEYSDQFLTVSFSEKFSGIMLVLLDTVSPERLTEKFPLKFYVKTLGKEFFYQFNWKYTNTNVISIPLSGFKDNYFFYDLYKANTKEIVLPNKVVVTDESIDFYLESDNYSDIDVLLLPTHKLLGNISYLKINTSNVENYLSTQNLLKDNLKTWVVTDQ